MKWLTHMFRGDAPIIVAILALLGTTVATLLKRDEGHFEIQASLCKSAFETLNDDRFNPALTPEQTRHYVAVQLKIIDMCVRKL